MLSLPSLSGRTVLRCSRDVHFVIVIFLRREGRRTSSWFFSDAVASLPKGSAFDHFYAEVFKKEAVHFSLIC